MEVYPYMLLTQCDIINSEKSIIWWRDKWKKEKERVLVS